MCVELRYSNSDSPTHVTTTEGLGRSRLCRVTGPGWSLDRGDCVYLGRYGYGDDRVFTCTTGTTTTGLFCKTDRDMSMHNDGHQSLWSLGDRVYYKL